jgi:hypothetical protein
MSTMQERTKHPVIALAVPQLVATAAAAVAAREGISLSAVARRALLNDLRSRGLIEAA